MNNEEPPNPGAGGAGERPIKQEVPEEANQRKVPIENHLLLEPFPTDEQLNEGPGQNYGQIQPVDDNQQNEHAEDVIDQQVHQEHNIEQDTGFDDHQVEHRHEMGEHLDQVGEDGIVGANQARNEEVPDGEARDLPPVENGHNANRVPEIKQEVPEEANQRGLPIGNHLMLAEQPGAVPTDEDEELDEGLGHNYGQLQPDEENQQNEHAEEAAEDVINQRPAVLQEHNMEQDMGFDDQQVEHRHEMGENLNQVGENGIERANGGRNEGVPNGEARTLPTVENGHNANRPEIKQEVRDNEQDNNVHREIKVEPNQNVDNHQAEHQQNMGEQQNHFGEIDDNIGPAQDIIISEVVVNVPPRKALNKPDSPEEIARAEAKPLVAIDELKRWIGVTHEELNIEQLHVNNNFITLLGSKKFNEEALTIIYDLLFRTSAIMLKRIEEEAKRRDNVDSLSPLQALCIRIIDSYTGVTVTCINDELRDTYRLFILVVDTFTRYKVTVAECETSEENRVNAANGDNSAQDEMISKNKENSKKYADEVAKKFRSALLGTSFPKVCCFHLVYRHLQEINDTYEEDVDFDRLPLFRDFDVKHARSIYLSSLSSYNYVYCQRLAASATEVTRKLKKTKNETEEDKKYEANLICVLVDNDPLSDKIWKNLLSVYNGLIGKTSKLLESDYQDDNEKELIRKKYDTFASDFKIFQRVKAGQMTPTSDIRDNVYHLDHLYLSLIGVDIFRYRYKFNNGANAGSNNEIDEVIRDGVNALYYLQRSMQFPDFIREALNRFEFIFDAGIPLTWDAFHQILPLIPRRAVARNREYLTVLNKYQNHQMMAQLQNQAEQPMIDNEPGRIDGQEGGEMMEDGNGFDNAFGDAPGVHPVIPNDHEHPELLEAPMDEDIDNAPAVDPVLRATRIQNKHHRQAFNKTMEMYSKFAANGTLLFDTDAVPIQPNRLQNNGQDAIEQDEDQRGRRSNKRRIEEDQDAMEEDEGQRRRRSKRNKGSKKIK